MPAPPPAGVHRAAVALTIGKATRFSAEVAISSVGLLAVGGLVASILLSTAVLVGVARRDRGGHG